MDQEMIAYFDEHFREARRYTESLHEHTTQQIVELRKEVTQQISDLRQETTEQIADLRQETTEQIRHTQILVEDMHGKIQIIAEGHLGLEEKLEVLREEMKENFKVVHSTLDVHYKDLDHRLRIVEKRTQSQSWDPPVGKSGTG